MSELYLTLHDVPEPAEREVRALLDKHFEEHPSAQESLYSEQSSAYHGATYEADTVARELAALGVSFRLAYRSDTDGVYEHTPALGMRTASIDDDGQDTVTTGEVAALAGLDTIDAVRAEIARLTGRAWEQAFAALDAARP